MLDFTKNNKSKLLALTPFFLGLVLLGWIWKPIAEWNLFIKPALSKKSVNFLSPLGSTAQNFEVVKKPNNLVFPSQNPNFVNGQNPFSLTIEKFGIKNAKVVTGDDFYNNLAHYPASQYPGQVGNVVISGHSVLPQFFSPKNYFTIFSRLYLLETGDEIVVETRDTSYSYYVSEMLVVGPSDVWVLSTPESYSSYLTLLTCGVGGFTQERIIVRAKLQNSQRLI